MLDIEKSKPPTPELDLPVWPEIKELIFACWANYGRSLMADAIARKAMMEGRIPRFFVGSGALDPSYPAKITGLYPAVRSELERRGHHPFSLSFPFIYSKPLQNCDVGQRTDLVIFLQGPVAEALLRQHPGLGTRPRSAICIPLEDPSQPQRGVTVEEAIAQVYDRLYHLIHFELPGIMTQVRKGAYNNPKHTREGIIYPFGYQPTARDYLIGEGEL